MSKVQRFQPYGLTFWVREERTPERDSTYLDGLVDFIMAAPEGSILQQIRPDRLSTTKRPKPLVLNQEFATDKYGMSWELAILLPEGRTAAEAFEELRAAFEPAGWQVGR